MIQCIDSISLEHFEYIVRSLLETPSKYMEFFHKSDVEEGMGRLYCYHNVWKVGH